MNHVNLHTIFNAAEAAWWMLVAIGVLVWSRQQDVRIRPVSGAAAVALIAFAGTDLVELQTGAWYRPWWLLVYNAICLRVS